jgi:PAS domain S-box-containing protein
MNPPEFQTGSIAPSRLLERVTDSIIVCDSRGRIEYWNGGSQRIYGWSDAEAIGKNIHELLATQLHDGTSELESKLAAAACWDGELKQVRRDGKAVVVASHWSIESTTAGARRLVISRDVTAERDAEEECRRSAERYRRFVDQDLTGDCIIDPNGVIIACNPAFVRIFGFETAEQVLSTNFVNLLRSRQDAAELIAAVREHGVAERHELQMRQPGGDAVYVAARFVATTDEQGKLQEIQAYLFNDTRRKRLEQQLIQAQKMEGLGTLAGGIAHDFNNILAIILGYATKLEDRTQRPEQITGAITVIKDAVERGAALVQQLLTSARQAEARFASLDLNDLLREIERMLQATFPKTISFELRLQRELPIITADRSQVHQVLLNLCVNARDAMANGGTITLETSLVRGAEMAEHFTDADAEAYTCIAVRDNGAGMTPEVRSHIFEPFFTTKERAKGTGLGLSVVYGVVNNHRGFVQVETARGRGTTFRIYLPVRRRRDETSVSDGTTFATGSREPQTILLVEDEEMLRDLAIQILQGEGYRVLSARDGLEAVDLFRSRRDEIGLVVCDLGLPKLGGRDVFLRMKEVKPTVRVIIASGYLEPAMRSEMLKAGVIDTIQKPYDFRELLVKIRSIIGDAQPTEDQPQLF